jgi:hypothetical protein
MQIISILYCFQNEYNKKMTAFFEKSTSTIYINYCQNLITVHATERQQNLYAPIKCYGCHLHNTISK